MLRGFLKFLKYLLITVLVIVVLLGAYLAVRTISTNHRRKNVSDSYEISEIRELSLGGRKQKIMIEGKSKDLPIVLFLHGGPGIPIPWNVGSRGVIPEITDKNIFVTWDQYGSGINKAKLDESFSTETLVDMAKDLVRELRKEFPDQKLTLFGVSWGSYLTARLAVDMPESIDSVVVYGQITKAMNLNDEIFNALRESNLPDKDKEKLETIAAKKEFDIDDALLVSKWVNRYTEGMVAKGTSLWDYVPILLDTALSPDYHIRDGIALMDNDYDDNKNFIQQVFDLDLGPLLQKVEIPYTILQGEYDLVTSTQAVKELVDSSDNPYLKLEILPDSSHNPSKEAIKKIIQFENYRSE